MFGYCTILYFTHYFHLRFLQIQVCQPQFHELAFVELRS